MRIQIIAIFEKREVTDKTCKGVSMPLVHQKLNEFLGQYPQNIDVIIGKELVWVEIKSKEKP